MYAHIEDPWVPVEETVGAFGELVASGEVGLLGVSNHWSWRVERARSAAVALGFPGTRCCSITTATCGRGPTCRDGGRLLDRRGWRRETCSTWCTLRLRSHAGGVLAAAERCLRAFRPAARARVRPRGDFGSARGAAVGGLGDWGDGQPGGAGLADGRGASGDPAGRSFVGGAARGEPGRGGPRADRGAAGAAGRGALPLCWCFVRSCGALVRPAAAAVRARVPAFMRPALVRPSHGAHPVCGSSRGPVYG